MGVSKYVWQQKSSLWMLFMGTCLVVVYSIIISNAFRFYFVTFSLQDLNRNNLSYFTINALLFENKAKTRFIHWYHKKYSSQLWYQNLEFLNIKVQTYAVYFGTSWIIKSTLIRLLNGCKNGTGLTWMSNIKMT